MSVSEFERAVLILQGMKFDGNFRDDGTTLPEGGARILLTAIIGAVCEDLTKTFAGAHEANVREAPHVSGCRCAACKQAQAKAVSEVPERDSYEMGRAYRTIANERTRSVPATPSEVDRAVTRAERIEEAVRQVLREHVGDCKCIEILREAIKP